MLQSTHHLLLHLLPHPQRLEANSRLELEAVYVAGEEALPELLFKNFTLSLAYGSPAAPLTKSVACTASVCASLVPNSPSNVAQH